jgi:hypothetical protein
VFRSARRRRRLLLGRQLRLASVRRRGRDCRRGRRRRGRGRRRRRRGRRRCGRRRRPLKRRSADTSIAHWPASAKTAAAQCN